MSSRTLSLALVLAVAGCGGKTVEEEAPDGGDASTYVAVRDGSAARDAAPITHFDAGRFECLLDPPDDEIRCAAPADCAVVFETCTCGLTPAYAANRASLAQIAACESRRDAMCPLDCAQQKGHVAQDGTTDTDGGSVVAVCVIPHDHGTFGYCSTTVR